MPADKKTLLRDAQKLVQKGQLDKAILTYRELVKLDPADAGVHNTLGDLYLKRGKKKEAIGEYLEVANHYESDGWGLRAIAMCQKILNLDGDLIAVRQKLADLYAGQKLPAEARAQYLQVADHYDRKGDVAAALGIFGKIADLDPENLAVRVKLAGMLERQKYPDRASAEYVRAARGYQRKKDPGTAIQLFVRAFKLHPANLEARRALAEFHHQRQDWQVLSGLLQPLVARAPEETDLLVLYGEALTHVNHAREAAKVLERVREREPNSVPVNLALGRALVKAGEIAGGMAALNRCVGAYLSDARLEQAEALLREMSATAPEDAGILERILEVLQRRGERDASADVWLRLAKIHEGKDRLQDAAAALETYVELRPGDAAAAETARTLRARAAAAAPGPPPPAAAVPSQPPPRAAAAPVPGAAAEEEIVEIDLEGEEELATLESAAEEQELEIEVAAEEEIAVAAAPAPAPAAAEAAPGPAWEEEEIELDLAASAGEEAPPAAAAPGGEEVSFEEVGAEIAGLEAQEPPRPEPAAAGGAVAVPETGTVTGEAAEFLAEADFYLQQGLLDEAAFIFRRLLAQEPGNAAVAQKLAAIDAERGGGPEPPAAAPPAEPDLLSLEGDLGSAIPEKGSMSFSVDAGSGTGGGEYADFLSDLRQELETGLTPPAAPPGGEEGLTEIFQEFQRSVKEQLGEEDFETHYNLGIAYKEMGLVEEAIGEFTLAERSPTRGLDALSMIALCLGETGRTEQAMERLAEGAGRAAPGSNEQKGLLYDLAVLQQRCGREEEARETFRRLAAVDPGYRDVAARVGAAGGTRATEAGGSRKRPKVSYL